jgi:hypothetical protein
MKQHPQRHAAQRLAVVDLGMVDLEVFQAQIRERRETAHRTVAEGQAAQRHAGERAEVGDRRAGDDQRAQAHAAQRPEVGELRTGAQVETGDGQHAEPRQRWQAHRQPGELPHMQLRQHRQVIEVAEGHIQRGYQGADQRREGVHLGLARDDLALGRPGKRCQALDRGAGDVQAGEGHALEGHQGGDARLGRSSAASAACPSPDRARSPGCHSAAGR